MGQALYRKYRSRSLKEIIGQEHITDTLARALQAERVSHAYLLTGPRGTGKTSVARILAFEINKLPYSDTPQLDIIEIDAASNRRIDDIRDLRDKVHIAPVSATYKVYIIDEVHMLTGESFNALLKTLEEPPSHVVFIMATTEAHKLPATIVSRTQRFAFRPVERGKVVAHLRDIASRESIAITDDALVLIAEHGEGSLRDSISLLDQLSHVSKNEITADDVSRTLGLAPQQHIDLLVAALHKKDSAQISTSLNALQAGMYSAGAIVAQLTKTLIRQAAQQPELYGLLDHLLDVPRAYNPDLKLITTLLLFANEGKPAKESRSAPALAAPLPIMASTPLEAVKAVQKQKAEDKTQLAQTKTPEVPLAAFDLTHWAAVLNAVKKANAPLFSVIKQAMPEFDASTHTLVLAFKYTLHSKKLDDTKQKAALASIIHATLGATPAIKVEVNKEARPPLLSADPVVTSVAAIMGGGEMVDAPA